MFIILGSNDVRSIIICGIEDLITEFFNDITNDKIKWTNEKIEEYRIYYKNSLIGFIEKVMSSDNINLQIEIATLKHDIETLRLKMQKDRKLSR